MKLLNRANLLKMLSSFLPLIFSLAATLIVVLHQIYAPDASLKLPLNAILLFMNLVEFISLAKNKSDNYLYPLSCIIYLFVLANFYNIEIVGIPSPLTNFSEFFNSICGVWIIIALFELAGFVLPSIMKAIREEQNVEQIVSISEKDQLHRNDSKRNDTMSVDSPTPMRKERGLSDGTFSQKASRASLKEHVDKHVFGPSGIWAFIICFAIFVIPFIPFEKLTFWFDSVQDIAEIAYGQDLSTRSALWTVILYVIMMATFATIFCSIFVILYYAVKGGLKDSKNGISAVLAKYSTPAVILIVVFVSIRSMNSEPNDSSFSLQLLSTILESGLLAVVGINGAFILFEAVRLMLNECIEQGSLLKTTMRLVFVLIVQHTTDLIIGILRAFAVKDVIESILLFFMPDLNVTFNSKMDSVLNSALEKEVHNAEKEMSSNNQKSANKEED